MSSSAFISGMDSMEKHKTTGVNGSDVYSVPVGKEQELLALFGAINRDLEKTKLLSLLDNVLSSGETDFADLVVLAFHTRDIREGKGERNLFYTMFNYLYQKNPDKLLQCLNLISYYGCWVDLQKLSEEITDEFDNTILKEGIIQTYITQLKKDAMNKNNNELSLAPKWAPREGKQWDGLAKDIAKSMFSEIPLSSALKNYRKLLSELNKRLNTVEIKMCHDTEGKHHFADIEPKKVPSKCLKIKRKAFYFENKKSNKTYNEEDEKDRIACKEHFEEHVAKAVRGDGKVHGRVLMPHEFSMLISKNSNELSENEKMTIEAQWIDLRNSILEKGSLGKVVIMSDFSGSMCSGNGKVNPIDVAKGLGVLCAECTSPAFKNRIMTFDTNPSWVDLSEYSNLFEKILQLESAPWGGSTNFAKAIEKILETLVKCNVPLGEEPDMLLCITDMGWDSANSNGNFETHIDKIKRRFKETGGWKVPMIVIWNVSGKFQEYHHESETEGVCLISGWSPNILKYLLDGENIIEKIKGLTPYKFMRDVLDDTRYDKVRAIFS